MFVGVEFAEEGGGSVSLVHEKWMTPRKRNVWWPPTRTNEKFYSFLKKGELPNEDSWKLYSIRRQFFRENEYHKALCKIKRVEVESDINNTDLEEIPQKRKRLKPQRFISPSESEDEGEGEPEPRYELPPKIKEVGQLLKCNPGGSNCSESTCSNPKRDPQRQRIDNPEGLELNQESCESLVVTPNLDPKKIIQTLTFIKNQNSEILAILKNTKTVGSVPTYFELPSDIPINLPINSLQDLRTFERYIEQEDNRNGLISYLSSLGGQDLTTKTNCILRKVVSNSVAAKFSFLGSRNNKNNFQQLKLKEVIVQCYENARQDPLIR